MKELSERDVQALADAIDLPITPGDLTEVTHRLNALFEALTPLADLPLDTVEPNPVLPDLDGGLAPRT